MSKRRRLVAGVVWALTVTGLSACDLPDTGDPDPATSTTTLSTVVRPSAGSSRPEPGSTVVEPPAEPPAPSTVDASEYDRMCRHYCGMLEDTLFFSCLGAGREADGCRQGAASTTARCFELRCAPQLVKQPLCFTQCDSLAAQYGTACAASTPANETACAATPAAHDRSCREGCGPAAP